ncbi:hypothetical protein CCR75_008718 [Bremia lactucae]|uniref:Uncharacterized protein n=1 Tax=Bremia lactucae TaxID=4779 RepID=A0A976NZ57_BRELC|nr:hypothetical protein CCR75_008718 [Bremia lactucae]
MKKLPRDVGSPPDVTRRSFVQRTEPNTLFEAPFVNATIEQNEPPAPPQQPHAPQPFGVSAKGPINTSVGTTRRGWRPGSVGGRHDSPLFGKHRKRPSSSSIDSNVSWSGSEIDALGGFGVRSEQDSRLSWASSVATKEAASPMSQQDLAPAAALFGASSTKRHSLPLVTVSGEQQAIGGIGWINVQQPKTPLENDRDSSATQHWRMDNSLDAGSYAVHRANSSENVFANATSPRYDEEKNGPQSCPTTINNSNQLHFSIDKLRQLRSNELVASKLLPTRASVNSLMGYVRELQLSESSLRNQLVRTKQHTEDELSQSVSRVQELERTMMEVERDRMLALRKLEEQEKLIRTLAAKLKEAEITPTNFSTSTGIDELPPINEEGSFDADTENAEKSVPAPVPPDHPKSPHELLEQKPILTDSHNQSSNLTQAVQLASPRSPSRPLWDPWASGGATSMKNLPPVFSIGSTSVVQAASQSASDAQPPATSTALKAARGYELQSVLISPRQNQGQAEVAEANFRAYQIKLQGSFNEMLAPEGIDSEPYVGAWPSSSLQQRTSFVPETKRYGGQEQEDNLLMQPSLQNHPMQFADEVAINGNAQNSTTEISSTADAIATKTSFQHEEKLVATSFSPSVDASTVVARANEKGVTSTVPASLPDHTSPTMSSQDFDITTASIDAVDKSESVEGAQLQAASNFDAASDGIIAATSPPTSSTTRPISSDGEKALLSKPLSLEALLINFYTEVDEKRLKMAAVYSKRYAGREKWLFAELTKRYGAARVAALKEQYEMGMDAATSSNTRGGGKMNEIATNSNQLKFGYRNHPISSVGFGAAGDSFQQNNARNLQFRQEAKKSDAPSNLSNPSLMHRQEQAPLRRHPSEGSDFSGSDHLKFSQSPQKFLERRNSTGVGSGNPLLMKKSTSAQRDEPIDASSLLSSSLQNEMQTNSDASLGLRLRHNTSRPSTQHQKGDLPVVTLESLLTELYKTHQPDKLKNVSTVAKQYAGKERELIKLLRGKYGALSVKRLEENLETLELAHRAHTKGKRAGRKRGCFIRTISLMFSLSLLLYFSFGAVFISFVVLDAWECHTFDNDEKEPKSAEECGLFRKELKSFTYHRVADYVSQSYSNACFCAEWNERKSMMLSSFSFDEVVNMAKLIPFSPDSFGRPWIASVKKQILSQESYDSYAKPVMDYSLSAGFNLWTSVLELTDYYSAPETISHHEATLQDEVMNASVIFTESERVEHMQKQVDVSMENTIRIEAKDQLTDATEEVNAERFEKESDAEHADGMTVKAGAVIAENVKNKENVGVADQQKIIEAAKDYSTEEGVNMKDKSHIGETDTTAKADTSEEDVVFERSAAKEKMSEILPFEADVEVDARRHVDVLEPNEMPPLEKLKLEEITELTNNLENDVTEIIMEENAANVQAAGSVYDEGVEESYPDSEELDTAFGMNVVVEAALDGLDGFLSEEKAALLTNVVNTSNFHEGVGVMNPVIVSDAARKNLSAVRTGDLLFNKREDNKPAVDFIGDNSIMSINLGYETIIDSDNVLGDVEAKESKAVAAVVSEDIIISSSRGTDSTAGVTVIQTDGRVLNETLDVEINDFEKATHIENMEGNKRFEDATSEPLVSDDIYNEPVFDVLSENDEDAAIMIVDNNVEKSNLDAGEIVEEEKAAFDGEGFALVTADSDRSVEEDAMNPMPELPNGSNNSDEAEPSDDNDLEKTAMKTNYDMLDEGDSIAESIAPIASVSGNGVVNLHDDNLQIVEADIYEMESAILAETDEGELKLKDEAADETVVNEFVDDTQKKFVDLERNIGEASSTVGTTVLIEAEQLSPPYETEMESSGREWNAEDEGDMHDTNLDADTSNQAEHDFSEIDILSRPTEESVATTATEDFIDVSLSVADYREKSLGQDEDDKDANYAGAIEATILLEDNDKSESASTEASLSSFVGEEVDASEIQVSQAVTGLAELVVDDSIEVEEIEASFDKDAIMTDENESKETVFDEFLASASGVENGGLVFAVNEVLARLVEPFELAKTTMDNNVASKAEDEL